MIQGIGAQQRFVLFDRRSQAVSGAVALTFSILAGAWMLERHFVVAPQEAAEAPSDSAALIASKPYGSLLVGLRSGSTPFSLAQSFPFGSNFESAPAVATEVAEAENVRPTPTPEASQDGDGPPLPPRRPAEFGSQASRNPLQSAARQLAQQTGKPAPASVAPENRSFFESFFGLSQQKQSSGQALAYAAPDSGVLGAAKSILSAPMLRNDPATAVYDISAHTVYLPNGTKLEAHSGLRDRLDNPRYVHEKMRGPTPPNVYELEPREKLFHGVQALRLKPVGGGTVFGRAGLLAHTYMLGPNGDSNGCVVFKNYNAFLQAFQNGDVKRLVVVAHLD